MVKLVVALVAVGALAAGVFLAPVRGRTVMDRWSAAPDAGAFARNAWREARAALGDDARPPPEPASALPQADRRRSRPSSDDARRRSRTTAQHPAEHHSAEDRAALDRLLSERSQ